MNAQASIILASKSQSRRAMLDNAGVRYDAIAADLDERALESDMAGASPSQIAQNLAIAKAHNVAASHSDRIVLGSDSLVAVGNQRFDKPVSRANAAEHLRTFSGQTMHLHSAAALVRGKDCIWQHCALAKLHVRALGDEFIEHYLDAEWPQISYCAGAFRIEAMGAQLFSAIEGDQFTVLGMPLLPVLDALRSEGALMS